MQSPTIQILKSERFDSVDFERKSTVLKTPQPEVFVKNLTDSAIELVVRSWANNLDFRAVFTETLENYRTAFDLAGIVIQPYVKEISKTNS